MPPLPALDREHDPCMQIQVDLSAMLDGELDAASVRRVMVHSDACASCRGFLQGIRSQVRMHRELALAKIVTADGSALDGAAAVGAGGPEATEAGDNSEAAMRLRQQLTDNREKLSKILYELGRCFVLMGLSPDFSREVSKEPVPMPDMAQRGRHLLDEVARAAESEAAMAGGNAPGSNVEGGDVGGGDDHDGSGAPWVAAKELFDGRWCSAAEALAKGQRLLTECLALDPDSHESRIYLGLVHHVRGQRTLAKQQFSQVLAGTKEPVMRGYALLNLGNLHLDEGDCDGAAELLLEVVESGVVAAQPRLGMAYFNLGLAYGLKGEFDESLRWFQRLHDELPHRRSVVARELQRRSQFLHIVRSHPGIRGRFAETLPGWFAEAG